MRDLGQRDDNGGGPATIDAATIRRRLLDGHRGRVISIGLTAFIGGISEATFLVAVTRAAFAITDGADRFGIVAGWYVSIGPGLAIALALAASRVGFAILAGWQSATLSSTVVSHIQTEMATAFLDASWAAQQEVRAGNLQQLLTNHAAQARLYITATTQAVAAVANLLAMLGLAIAVDPLGAVVLVASVSVLATLLRPLRSAVHRRAAAASDANLEFAEEISRVSEIGLELHVFHVQDAVREHVGRSIAKVRSVGRRLQFATALTTPTYVGLAYAALICALWAVSSSDATSLTSIGAAMLVMLRSLSYGQALQTAKTQISSSTPSLVLFYHHRDVLRSGRRRDGGEPVGRIDRLEARHVTFSYDGETEALRDVSFEIGRHEIVGVIGPSGSGKTTLVQLLLGLRSPADGHVLANGTDVAEFARSEWARRVVFVPQTDHLLAGSVADNIRFFRADVDQDRIVEAAKLAQIHDDILEFRGGYDREVGERGDQLSGGQRQRICIARALAEQPDVLILDEPTSALDVRSEHLIRSSLLELREHMTIIVIAHRLSTLDICDRIMVIQNGELVGFDAPSSLEDSNPFYREALVLSGLR